MTPSHKSPGKDRLDQWLLQRGLCDTRSQAQSLILAGHVRLGSKVLDKPGQLLSAADAEKLSLIATLPYVSRGGLKLEKALKVFQVDASNQICLDVGASTGGFTDCLLQHGASKVYSVDVGYGQLDWKLRQDPRVVAFEKTNIKTFQLPTDDIRPSLAVVDVSFISLKKVLPHVASLLAPQATVLALIKPQFEYLDYIQDTNFKGVVKETAQHQLILERLLEDLSRLLPGWHAVGLAASPLLGPKGNREFLLHLIPRHLATDSAVTNTRIQDIVACSMDGLTEES